MNLKKFLIAVSGFIAVALHAQEVPLVSISPSVGQYLESQKFDIAVNVSALVPLPDTLLAPYYDAYSTASPIKINAFVNGRDVTAWFSECMQEHRTLGGVNRVLLCRALDTSPFTVGDNHLKIDIFNGSQLYTASADYTLIASERKNRQLPYQFVIQGASANTQSGVRVALNNRVIISASGYVNTWPANTSFPISTPKGTQVCASNSTCLLPGAPVGGLLVKIGAYGRWIFVGSSYALIADRPGELIFAVNDKSEQVATSDNTGSYDITVAK